MAAGSHRQPLRNPTDAGAGLGAQLGSQPQLERMPLAPDCELLLSDAIGSERLGDEALRFGFRRFAKLHSVVPLAPLLLNVVEGLASKWL